MYTESQNGNLQLVFNSLKADQAGRYVCTATYANNEALSKSVKIEIVGKSIQNIFVCYIILYKINLNIYL